GQYKIKAGKNPNGTRYGGNVSINKVRTVYTVGWSIANTPPFSGVGLLTDNLLGIGWGRGGRSGVIVYKINGGSLSGWWTSSDMGGVVRNEELRGPAGLNATYRIVQATHDYTGTATITPQQGIYTIHWRIGSGETYNGIGIRDGDLLVVGYGNGTNEY